MEHKDFDYAAFFKVIGLFVTAGVVSTVISLIVHGGCGHEDVAGVKVTVTSTETNNVWIGHPVVSDNDRYTPSQGWISDYQIGFRSDGVVVWKRISATKIYTNQTP